MKPPIFTLCVGNAWGEAALLLAAGSKGNRSALPSATIMLKQVRPLLPAGTQSALRNKATHWIAWLDELDELDEGLCIAKGTETFLVSLLVSCLSPPRVSSHNLPVTTSISLAPSLPPSSPLCSPPLPLSYSPSLIIA